jgi:hypothetical protein
VEIVLPYEALVSVIDTLTTALEDGGCTAHLFVGPQRVTPALELSEITEASFPGYAAQVVGPWNGAERVAPLVSAQAPKVSWAWSGLTPPEPQQIVGAYLTVGGELVWIQVFPPGAVVVSNDGDLVEVVPEISFRSISY